MRRRWWLSLVVNLACASGGGGTVDAAGPSDAVVGDDRGPEAVRVHPLDDVLRVNHIQMKGTHNSYHVAGDNPLAPEWRFTQDPIDVQLDRQGVRSLELDVHYSSGRRFPVFHVPVLDERSTCATLADCLLVAKTWSDAHPSHHVLVVGIEPKDEIDEEKFSGHVGELDEEILSVWPRERIVTPDDVRGTWPTLREALQNDGWPTLGQTRGKAMFLLLEGGGYRDEYLMEHPGLAGAVMFARGGRDEPWGAVIQYGDAVADGERIVEDVRAGFLARIPPGGAGAPPEVSQANADAALASGVHVIATDYARAWTEGDYVFDIPGGTPSRCNPITAPPECTPEAIEDLDLP